MVNFRKYFIHILFILLSLSTYCSAAEKKCIIYLTSDYGKKITLDAEIADTPSSREQGLMYRKRLGNDSGMLFIFEKEQKLNFWMKNTFIPLDIAYIDRNGIINEIYQMKPLDVSVTYNSVKPAMFALEANLGWFSSNKIKPGSKIEFNGCLSKPDSLFKR